MSEEKRSLEERYLTEVASHLRREDFTLSLTKDGYLAVTHGGSPIGWVNGKGGFGYETGSSNPQMDSIRDKAREIVGTTWQYMNLLDKAPMLQADGLSEGYKLLAEFNDVVLAGREQELGCGVQFVTWQWTHGRTSLWQGHYMENDYAKARQEFAVRSGLIDPDRLFSNEQLAEIYRCIHETLDSEYPITDARRELLQGACKQVENAVPDLEERVGQSNQEELELTNSLQEMGGY